jgi:hypothetical protein
LFPSAYVLVTEKYAVLEQKNTLNEFFYELVDVQLFALKSSRKAHSLLSTFQGKLKGVSSNFIFALICISYMEKEFCE